MSIRRRSLGRGPDGERGAGLVIVLAIGAALLAMGALAVSLFQSSSTGATRHVRGEQALHAAEQGIDQAIGRLQDSAALSYNTSTPSALNGNVQLPDPPASVDTPAEEQAWLAANFGPSANTSGYGSGWLQTAPDGQFVSIRPASRKTIYSVSWIPTRANPKRVRVIKAEYLPANFNPIHAIQVGGSLELAGNSAVAGIAGSVHANGDISTTGNSVNVSKTVSTSGTFNPDPPNFQSVGGTEKAAPKISIPKIDPLKYWQDNHGLTQYSSAWLDFCTDGKVYSTVGATAPCTGPYVADEPYQGWDYNSSTNTWSYNSAGTFPGVFYINQANVKITGSPGSAGSPWRATIIASAGSTSGSCGHTYGEIDVSGSPVVSSYGAIYGLTMMAGTDLIIGGTTQAVFSGLYAAHEQVLVNGNGTLDGSIVAQDHCDTPGTTVSSSKVTGSMSITYNKDVTASVGTVVRTTLWQELSARGF